MRIVAIEALDPWMDALVGLYQQAYQGLEEYADTTVEEIKKYLRWLYKRTPDSFFIALEDEKVWGFIVADYRWKEKGEPVGEVHELVVSPLAREKGLGKALMDKALDLFREKGLRKAGLWVGVKNHNAYRFYSNLGFQETGRVGIWIRMERFI